MNLYCLRRKSYPWTRAGGAGGVRRPLDPLAPKAYSLPATRPVRTTRRRSPPWPMRKSSKQLLHLVFGGELKSPGRLEFADCRSSTSSGSIRTTPKPTRPGAAPRRGTIDDAHVRLFRRCTCTGCSTPTPPPTPTPDRSPAGPSTTESSTTETQRHRDTEDNRGLWGWRPAKICAVPNGRSVATCSARAAKQCLPLPQGRASAGPGGRKASGPADFVASWFKPPRTRSSGRYGFPERRASPTRGSPEHVPHRPARPPPASSRGSARPAPFGVGVDLLAVHHLGDPPRIGGAGPRKCGWYQSVSSVASASERLAWGRCRRRASRSPGRGGHGTATSPSTAPKGPSVVLGRGPVPGPRHAPGPESRAQGGARWLPGTTRRQPFPASFGQVSRSTGLRMMSTFCRVIVLADGP